MFSLLGWCDHCCEQMTPGINGQVQRRDAAALRPYAAPLMPIIAGSRTAFEARLQRAAVENRRPWLWGTVSDLTQ